jgi:hypothetical protein
MWWATLASCFERWIETFLETSVAESSTALTVPSRRPATALRWMPTSGEYPEGGEA